MTWTASTCPVSNEPAERKEEEAAGFQQFKCPSCRKFRISDEALEALSRYDGEGRLEILLLARNLAGDDEVPLIDKVP